MTGYWKDLAVKIGDQTSIMSERGGSAESTGWIDTGSYAINAQVSGSIYGGIPDNRVTALAGAEATGKTYFLLGMMRAFQDKDPSAGVYFSSTESATDSAMMESRGVDTDRVLLNEPENVQQFTHRAVKLLDDYYESPLKDRPPMMIALDSIGNLPSRKELEDAKAGSEARDMTRPQVIRSAFRVLTLRAARAKVPVVLTNHTYTGIDRYDPVKMAGGGGIKYAASTILFLSKLKDKYVERDEGAILKSYLTKSRYTREKTIVQTRLTFKEGLDRYFGLVDIAVSTGLLKREAGRIVFPDGSKNFEKSINQDPLRFWTNDLLEKLDVLTGEYFKYGGEIQFQDEDLEEEE